ncbi:FKBP-type peptidyl-prolyl cis-trans isomerase N-terminal domain-containing protein [Serratia bockelmannii]|uniref:FKBP-type peptidyl-prolyl cis-trans isomerase N-terminal domain-containing protein n=1 Tax=Serratia bockelmannii TaxID=2703793 RepID=UPI0023617BEA|nr:FKBP-type peptidyl-prolyl cis-trans isomerase N-terminal domain-containing protein [Serratia bockelmannii]
MIFSGVAQADEGIPALLQFAEHYQRQKPSSSQTENTVRKKAATPATAVPLRQEVLARDQQLAQQRIELNALHQALADAQLKRQPTEPAGTQPTPPALPDLRLLRQWMTGLRAVWHGAPDARHAADLLRQATQDVAEAKQATELANQRATAAGLAEKSANDALGRLRQSSETELQSLRTAAQDYKQQLTQQLAQAKQVSAALTALQQRVVWYVTPAQLENVNTRLSYAAGSVLGHDILTMINERQGWGVPVERDGVLAGIVDAVSGHLQLPPDVLARLGAQADNQVTAARGKQGDAQRQRDKAYVAQFTSQKGVKTSPMGYWYRVDYAGKGGLASDTPIDVVVSEKLTDGTVIQDMDLNHKVLTQPLSAFPPLFRDALGHLDNHGSLTMVVPPALAYGDAGYPPKVPPSATMVYTLRAENGAKAK